MPIEIDGKKYYRTSEALRIAGISRSTFAKNLRKKKIQDTEHVDRNGRRLFTEQEIKRLSRGPMVRKRDEMFR